MISTVDAEDIPPQQDQLTTSNAESSEARQMPSSTSTQQSRGISTTTVYI